MKLSELNESELKHGQECYFRDLSPGEYFRFKYGPGKYQKVNDIHYEELENSYMHTANPAMHVVKLSS